MPDPTLSTEQLLAARATRRRFLTVSGAAAALALTTALPQPEVATAGRQRAYPFTLGVASGDPLPDGVVIWTRLAPQPLAPFGGMEYAKVPVRWEVARDPNFAQVVRRGVTFARPEFSHCVHVDVRGLRPGREYFYRFATREEISPVGRTQTAPALDQQLSQLSIAYASCQAWWDGFYAPYRDLADSAPDVVFHLGDYLYEYGIPADGGHRRDPTLPTSYRAETITLDQYRERYALYKLDPDLQAAHRVAPWIVTMDDHEVENNWADEIPENSMPRDEFVVRRANALRAWWEHMPMRLAQQPVGPDMQVYRRFRFGDLAEFTVLDTRQYRSDQPNGDGTKPPSAESKDPARTITGDAQERWLLDGLAASQTRWNVIAHQTAIMRIDTRAGPDLALPMDTWDGYEASRARVLGGIHERRVQNPVFISGDLHRSLAADLLLDFDDPDSPVVSVEMVGTSISSGRDGEDNDEGGRTMLAENPWIRYGNFQRGYVRALITPQEMRAEYRVVPYVTRPGADSYTRTTLVVQDGVPGLQTA